MTALLDQILPGPRHAIQAQLFELFVQLTYERPPARLCLCAGCRSAPCRPGRLATSGHIELREPSCPSVPADVCQNGQMIQNKDCVLTDGLLFRNWTRVRFRVPPPLFKKPTVIGWFFFARFPLCWRGFRGWPLEHTPSKTPLSGPHSATFLSLFSAALLSIQGPKSFIDADLRAICLLFRLLGMARPRQQKT